MGSPSYRNAFKLTLHPHLLEAPLRWKKPRVVFVNSMSDMFHKDVPEEYIQRIFEVMARSSRHVFQSLTKRTHRLVRLSPRLPWPGNVWMGTTVEHVNYLYRIEQLRQCGAQTKFLSLEPLLGPLPGLDLREIDWVIVGGESGPGARPMRKEWVTDIRRQCREQHVPFFFKQWGGVNKRKTGRKLEGRIYDEVPDKLKALGLQGELAL